MTCVESFNFGKIFLFSGPVFDYVSPPNVHGLWITFSMGTTFRAVRADVPVIPLGRETPFVRLKASDFFAMMVVLLAAGAGSRLWIT